MNISELSTTESRQLLLIHTKLNYENAQSVSQVVRLIKARGFFQTEAGMVYRNAIEDYEKGKFPIDCIYCRKPLEYGENLICRECGQELFVRVNEENKEIQKERAEVKAAQEAAVKIAQNINNPDYEEQEELLAYARERLEIIAENPSMYAVMPEEDEYDAESNQYVADSGDFEETQALYGRRNAFIVSRLIPAIISVILIALMLVLIMLRVGPEKADVQAKGNESANEMPAVGTEETYNMADNEPDMSPLAEDTKSSYILQDGYELLGCIYTEVDDEYGDYEEMLSENARYYPECGVSLLFNEETGRIIYIENDGSGTGMNKVPILGILPGDSTVKMIKTLSDNGLEPAAINDDNFICQFGSYANPDITYELSVTSNEGIINLICIRVIQ